MSAWIASDKHIASLVCSVIEEPRRQLVADRLKSANIRSVNYRYNEKTKLTPCDLSQGENLPPTHVIKLAHSLDYQSCERPEWYKSKARQDICEIVFRATSSMLDDAAPWSI